MAFVFRRSAAGGWWYYFPAALLLKTPLPLLLLLVSTLLIPGLEARDRRALLALVLPAAVYLALAMRFRFNIGVRRLLPILPLLCIVASMPQSGAVS